MLYVNKIELKNVTRVHGHFIKSVNNNSIQFKVYWQTIGNHLPLAIHIYTCTDEIKLFFCKLTKRSCGKMKRKTQTNKTKIQYKRTPKLRMNISTNSCNARSLTV